MSFHNCLKNLRSATQSPRDWPRGTNHRPTIEVLEDRCVPAQYAVTDLGALGGHGSTVVDVNELGQAVGYASNPNGTHHAVLWHNGTMIDLGTLGGQFSSAQAINDLGQVVGAA